MSMSRRPYVGVQVTLTSHLVTYNLLTLINAVIAAETGIATGGECPGTAREMTLQAPTGNTGVVYIGDGFLVAAGAGRQSGEITKGLSRHYGTGDTKSVDLGQIYVTPATDGDKLNVEVLVG